MVQFRFSAVYRILVVRLTLTPIVPGFLNDGRCSVTGSSHCLELSPFHTRYIRLFASALLPFLDRFEPSRLRLGFSTNT
jgi:hypothetical protein